MERGIVRVRVGLSYDPLRLSPCSLICKKIQIVDLFLVKQMIMSHSPPQQQTTNNQQPKTNKHKPKISMQRIKVGLGQRMECLVVSESQGKKWGSSNVLNGRARNGQKARMNGLGRPNKEGLGFNFMGLFSMSYRCESRHGTKPGSEMFWRDGSYKDSISCITRANKR